MRFRVGIARRSLRRWMARVWRHAACVSPRDLRRPAPVQQGQSLTELALLTPVLLLGVLGSVNLGLALQAHTALTQVTQQAAQYLLDHPASTSCVLPTPNYQSCTEQKVADYLSSHGFPCSAADGGSNATNCAVTVTFSTVTVGSQYDLIGTITARNQFSLFLPIPSGLNSGSLHGSSMSLSAQVASILPTDAPQIISATYSGGVYTVTWNPPTITSVSAAFATGLRYRIYSHGLGITSDSQLVSGPPYSYTDNCSQVPCDPNHYSYEVSAIQPIGMESDASASQVQQ